MVCDPSNLWDVNPGDKFVIDANGDENIFDVAIGVNLDGNQHAVWHVPPKKEQEINAGEDWAFHVLVNVFQQPDAETPVHLEAHTESATGAVTNSCSSDFTHAGHFPFAFLVSA